MRIIVLTCVLLLAGTSLEAQVKTNVKATGKHEKAYNTAKKAQAEAKAQKERIKRIKEQRKASKKYKEQFGKQRKKELSKLKKLGTDSLKKLGIDSLKMPVFTKEDSVALAERILTATKFPEKYKKYIRNPMPLDSMVLQSIDSSSFDVEKILEAKAKELLPSELAQQGKSPLDGIMKNPLEGGSTPNIEGAPDLGSLPNQGDLSGAKDKLEAPTRRKPNPNLIKPKDAQELFKKIDPKKFAQVQADITKLKKKYSTMPDTRFPNEGRKRNSLEDLPMKKRIFVGGNVNAASTDPFILDSNIQVGYWINKKWLAGAGFILREQFNNRDSIALTGDAHGYNFFMRYDIKKGFYAWGESQRQINKSLLHEPVETNKPIKWQEAHLLGIGRDYQLGPVKMTSLIMYDFNYQNNELNSRPLVFRLGVQFTKKPR